MGITPWKLAPDNSSECHLCCLSPRHDAPHLSVLSPPLTSEARGRLNGSDSYTQHGERGFPPSPLPTKRQVGKRLPPPPLASSHTETSPVLWLCGGPTEKATLHPSSTAQHWFLVSRETCTERTPELAKETPQFIEDYKGFCYKLQPHAFQKSKATAGVCASMLRRCCTARTRNG